jgi:hypothetical protein
LIAALSAPRALAKSTTATAPVIVSIERSALSRLKGMASAASTSLNVSVPLGTCALRIHASYGLALNTAGKVVMTR